VGKTVEVKRNWSKTIGVTIILRAELADGETSMTAANDLASIYTDMVESYEYEHQKQRGL
jgi:hypothetical protein